MSKAAFGVLLVCAVLMFSAVQARDEKPLHTSHSPGQAASQAAVEPDGTDGPVIVRGPSDMLAAPGWSCRLTVAATGLGDLHYRWERNGRPVGQDSPELLVQKVGPEDAGMYVCRVMDDTGTSVSRPVKLALCEPANPDAVRRVWVYVLAALGAGLSAVYLRRVV